MKNLFLHPVVSFILKSVISISLLSALFYYIDSDKILRSYVQANKLLLTIGALLVAANTGIHFLRWRFLLRLIEPDVSNNTVITSLLVGFTAGFFTPAQVGEIAGRIASHPDARKSHIVGITLIDKLYLLALTLITGLVALIFYVTIFFTEYWNGAYVFPLLIIVVAACIASLFPQTVKTLLIYLPRRVREHKLYNMISIIETTFHNTQGRYLFLLTSALYGVIAVQFYVFINAFESVQFFESIVCTFSIYFVKTVILPVSIGDLGVRESASVFFFSKVGVSAASAFSASLCMFVVNVLLPSVVGALFILKLKLR
jgi:uncharacterized membrane protein YbhN (UPF0104 family)